MALRLRRGTNVERGLITPADGELVYTTDTKRLYVGDGTTVGGNPVDTAGHLTKVSTSDIEMTPNTTIAIGLDEINKQIADQKGIQVKDLAVNESSVDEVGTIQETVPSATVDDVVTTKDEPLSDEDLARKMRTDADVMFKEAEQLRKDAEKLSPSTKAKASGKA